jgi:hypothetical protein
MSGFIVCKQRNVFCKYQAGINGWPKTWLKLSWFINVPFSDRVK